MDKEIFFESLRKNCVVINLAKKLAASFISVQMGLNFQTAYKRYCSDGVGDYWLLIAFSVLDDYKRGELSVGVDK